MPTGDTVPTGDAVLAATRMAARLTVPFERGADTLRLRTSFAGTEGTVDGYDFAEHFARFGRVPEPRYVLGVARDIDDATTVTVTFADHGTTSDVTVALAAGTSAGTSFLIPLPVSATGRLTTVKMVPAPRDNRPDLSLTVTALLGTIAKLLWVLGAERDQLRRHAGRTAAQRHLRDAVGLSLDLIGFDLGVPRFPPLPYGFDPDTVALYHLDEEPGTKAIADSTAGFPGRAGNPGAVTGAVELGAAGRYGKAFGFRAAGGAVDVAAGTAFDIAAAAGATVECFVRPDPGADGPVLSRHPLPGGAGAGWVLAVGEFGRGLAGSVRLTFTDGTRTVDVFADRALPVDAFTHVAGVLDRAAGTVTLFFDGVPVAGKTFATLGAIVTTAALRIGAAAGGFRGVVDEVRVSSVARKGFAPALGEDDEHYRRRLRPFRRWSLPTPSNLQSILNEVVGPVDGREDPLIVDDVNAQLVRGARLVHVRPVTLRPGESIDSAGRRRVEEAAAVGTAAQEEAFDPDFLLRYDRANVDFGRAPDRPPQPGERAADAHLVQLGVADRLDRLVTLVGASGRLLVGAAFDPRAGDLRATGRAVLLGHSTVEPGRLAALAHRAGFDFVRFRSGAGDAQVYAAAAPGDYFGIVPAPASTGPTALDAGATVALSLTPAPPPDALVRWFLVPGGAGRGTIIPDTGPSTAQLTAKLTATAAGQLVVKADVIRGRRTVSATRPLRAGLADLADGATVSGDGTPGTPPSVVDVPGAFFHPAFLARHADARVDYGTVADNHLMQPAVAELLDALLTELGRRKVADGLVVTAAFNAQGDSSAKEGRRLALRHKTLTPGALAGAAFAAGFAHLQRLGADLVLRQPPGQLVAVRGPAGTEQRGVIELDEGATADFTVTPAPGVLTAAGLPGPLPGLDPRLGWSSGTFDQAHVTLGSNTQPTTRVTAGSAGAAWVQASYQIGTSPTPYTFQVRLRPPLDTPATVLTRDQHDLIMNVLNVLHPVGVEVSTNAIREHVVELKGGLLPVNPDYTYPKFRVRGVLPRQVRRPARG
jgi:hypothetical protein